MNITCRYCGREEKEGVDRLTNKGWAEVDYEGVFYSLCSLTCLSNWALGQLPPPGTTGTILKELRPVLTSPNKEA